MTTSKQEKTPWWHQGKTPDYRFSLANERTFLAWIRTSLAFLAGAVAVDQFTVHLASPMVRQGLALLLIVCAALLGALAYRRWVSNEKAMRQESDMPYTPLLLTVTLFITMIAAALAAIIIFD
ncbi:hypothetical protein BIY26_16040 [Brenneria goodwinii]|uniref:DUF202 domain-containing protein n=1 Tax=Brenneria goodwinii TaxID=1109412 RepID=A0AAE8EM98_9GAMM|nr:DUF202 domain-containing protein [Brenneria goodwinii]ATA23229.1 hypothetical protein AWC36_03440 [Brenneria goodwinii]RLM20355.1 hypothetical protein BIY26_16040 [Brenneria goodwinii]